MSRIQARLTRLERDVADAQRYADELNRQPPQQPAWMAEAVAAAEAAYLALSPAVWAHSWQDGPRGPLTEFVGPDHAASDAAFAAADAAFQAVAKRYEG